MRLICFIIGLFFVQVALTQQGSLRSIISNPQYKIDLGDTIWIHEPSIQVFHRINGLPVNSSHWHFKDNKLYIDTVSIKDSIKIQFRILPYKVNKYLFLYDSSNHQESIPPEYAMLNKGKNKLNEDWWNTSGVEYSGSYNRGLSLGNNQSLILNSALNLQLIGDIGDGIKITGAITDNQIPVQAEGNTRQIQEFDRLYIELKKENTSLTAGDFDLSKPKGYFQNYFKKSQGGLLKWKQISYGWQLQHSASIGISKGKFNRMTIPIVDGNQGPYRLKGRDAENFIIVLAASEKVFLDGIQLQRGEDADYIMDYNLGEIRFTPRRLVTNQMRVIIEFEYTDQNYLRSLANYNLEANHKNWSAIINYYRENDSKKPSVANDLDSLEKISLERSGDNAGTAISSKINKAGINFKPDRVYYFYKDTVVTIQGSSRNIQILEYLPNADSNALQVVFTEVGLGKGEYLLTQSNANGRIYKWVGMNPVTGEFLGTYAPYKILIAPRNQQLLSVGFKYQPSGSNVAFFSIESALSYLDKNRLSNLNDGDNTGIASKFSASAPVLKFREIKLTNEGSFEWNDNRFVALNPYRNPEFNRNWNIDSQTGFNDQLIDLNSKIIYKNKLETGLQFNHFKRNQSNNGNKYIATVSWKDSTFEIQAKSDWLLTSWESQATNYWRPSLSFVKSIRKYFSLGASIEEEMNERRDANSDSLLSTSFNFIVTNAFFKFLDRKENLIKINWKRRKDDHTDNSKFNPFSTSDEITINSLYNSHRSGIWDIQLSMRKLQFNNSTINDSIGQTYFLGQLDHFLTIRKSAFRMKTIYSIQSGAEPRTEYIYEERRPGDGDYVFIDFNKDGIRQIQEYVYAPDIDTARFVRIQLFNSEYIQVYQSSIHSNIGIDFSRLLKDKRINKVWRKFSMESLIRFTSKINSESNFGDRFNPYSGSIHQNNLIAFQKNLNQQLFFNRAFPTFEWSLQYLEVANQLLLISGIEKRNKKEINLKGRWTMWSKLDLLTTVSTQYTEKNTEFYSLQNFSIQTNSIDFSTNYRMKRDIRIQIGIKNKNAFELNNAMESAKIQDYYMVSQCVFKRKLSFRAEFKYISIVYQGATGSAVEFTMLDGLKNGNNYTGEIVIDYRFSKLVSCQFSFALRKASGSDPINTGRASIRANF